MFFEKLETIPLRIMVSYAPLVFSHHPTCFEQRTKHGKLFLICQRESKTLSNWKNSNYFEFPRAVLVIMNILRVIEANTVKMRLLCVAAVIHWELETGVLSGLSVKIIFRRIPNPLWLNYIGNVDWRSQFVLFPFSSYSFLS